MAIYAMADLHLSLTGNKPMDIFGARWQNYQQKIETAWKQTVTAADTVVIPGDISWGISLEESTQDLLFLDRLPGKKLIGRGNHDYWWATASKMDAFFAKNGITTIAYLHNCAHLVEGHILCGSRGWYFEGKQAPREADHQKIVNRECLRLQMSLRAGEALAAQAGILAPPTVFLHFPPVFGDYLCRPLVEVLKAHGVTDCYYGHIHGNYEIPPVFSFENIRFHIIAADYLQFCPKKVF